MINFVSINLNESGLIENELTGSSCDWRGNHCDIDLKLPDFEQALYFAPPASHWPVGCSRLHTYVTEDLTNLPEGGCFALLKTGKGFLGLLPLALKDSYGWLRPNDKSDKNLTLCIGNHGTEPLEGEKRVLAWATSDDPYQVFAETFRIAASIIPELELRERKSFPEPFFYLGWCSWEEYKKKINSDLLTQAIDRINAASIPVRYVLIDDGHQVPVDRDAYFKRHAAAATAGETEQPSSPDLPGSGTYVMRSTVPDKEKFPDGFKPILDRRQARKISWLGLWFPFCGGMCGIDLENNQTGIPNELLERNAYGGSLPKDDKEPAEQFMSMLLDGAKGFDFVKLDFMSFAIPFFCGASQWQRALAQPERKPNPNPYRQAWRMNRALEDLLPEKKLDLMNCNDHAPYNFFNHNFSNTARCSGDYSKGNPVNARAHLFQSYANMPFFGQIVWGDHDMFHSCDELAGRMMAVSKALSGGPVYLSDAPENFVSEHIKPLCYEDGLIPRPLAPAVPLPESLFLEYSTAGVSMEYDEANHRPYRVIAPLANGAAAVAAYHLSDSDELIAAQVKPDDYRFHTAMMQPYPGPADPPEEGLVVWDWYAGKAQRLEDDYRFQLEKLNDRLLLLLPIMNGWAVAGRFDKYLGPAAIEILENKNNRLRLRMHESGPLAVWLRNGTPTALEKNQEFANLGNGLFLLDLPTGTQNYEITVVSE